MKPLSAFYDMMLPELPGISTALLDLTMRLVARDLCTTTSAWRLPFDSVNLVAGQATYDLEPSEPQSEVVRLTSLTLANVLKWQLDEQRRTTQRSDRNETPPRYARDSPPFTLSPELLEITLMPNEVPIASLALGMQIIGSMKPTMNAAMLPDLLLLQFSAAMRFGTLSRLMNMGRKPWTDRVLAADYTTQWHMALNFAAYQAQTGNTRAPLRVRKQE